MSTLTNEQQAFMDSFKETHNQYEVSDEDLIAFLCGTHDEYFDVYTQVADAYNLWRDAIKFAKGSSMKKYSVTIERTGFAQYEIEAKDRDEAEALAWEKYDSADADNCVTNNIFEVEEIPKEAV
jgi:hypothetical protein